MNNDYSFMKTGFDLTTSSETELIQNITSVIFSLSKDALKIASKYVSHSDRNIIGTEDIKRSLMLAISILLQKIQSQAFVNEIEQIKNELFTNEEIIEEDDTDISHEQLEDITTHLIDGAEFTENKCTCGLCNCLNNIYTGWEQWEPKDAFEQILKKHVDKMN